ncbi:MAG TPA: DUF4386 domain-containing protein [Gemmatimonadaceae bacterium]|jgi:hypothetical protein
MTPASNTWTPQRAAKIAGAAYLLTYAPVYSWLVVYPKLFVAGDFARTATNIMAHAQLFRLTIVLDLLTVAGVVILNLALYELLAPVHRSLARLAAFWRLVESAVYAATTVCTFAVLSVLSGADYLQAFEPRQLQALARLLLGAYTSGFWVAMFFLSLGSTIYCYLLVRSRYIPRVLALFGVTASVLAVVGILTRFLFPAFITATFAAVRTLPVAALVLLALIVVPILSFELTIGTWLLVKGVRIPEHT